MSRENVSQYYNELAGLLSHSSPKVTLEYYTSIIQSKNIDLGANFLLFGHNRDTIKKEEDSKSL